MFEEKKSKIIKEIELLKYAAGTYLFPNAPLPPGATSKTDVENDILFFNNLIAEIQNIHSEEDFFARDWSDREIYLLQLVVKGIMTMEGAE